MSATFTVDTERISAASADIGQISAEIETQVGAMMGRLTALQDAWQGSASAGFQGVIAQWRGTQSQVRESLESINRLLQQAGRPDAAVEAMHVAVLAEPLRESGQRALIEAHQAAGDWVAARRQYDAFRSILRREIGVEPSAELRAVAIGR